MTIRTVEKEDEPVELKLIQGGRGSAPKPPGHDWLKDLQVGCLFLAKERITSKYELFEFEINQKEFDNDKRLIAVELYTPNEDSLWVDPIRFCFHYNLVKILREKEDQ